MPWPLIAAAIPTVIQGGKKEAGRIKDQGVWGRMGTAAFGENQPWEKNFWTSKNLLKDQPLNQLKNTLDPLNVFGLFGEGKKSKKEKEMKGYESELVGEKFDERQQGYLDQLLRTLSTVGAQQSNRASEFSAYNDLNTASAGAMQRGVNYQTLLAGQQGQADLSQRGDQQRMNNIQFLMALQAEKDAGKRAEMMNQWNQIAQVGSTAAQAYGYYKGYGGNQPAQ